MRKMDLFSTKAGKYDVMYGSWFGRLMIKWCT